MRWGHVGDIAEMVWHEICIYYSVLLVILNIKKYFINNLTIKGVGSYTIINRTRHA